MAFQEVYDNKYLGQKYCYIMGHYEDLFLIVKKLFHFAP